jgi:hypothetical protein
MDLNLEDLMKVEIDLVHGATGHKQKVSDATASITVITADENRWYPRILASSKSSSTLTVGEVTGFAKPGGIINLTRRTSFASRSTSMPLPKPGGRLVRSCSLSPRSSKNTYSFDHLGRGMKGLKDYSKAPSPFCRAWRDAGPGTGQMWRVTRL